MDIRTTLTEHFWRQLTDIDPDIWVSICGDVVDMRLGRVIMPMHNKHTGELRVRIPVPEKLDKHFAVHRLVYQAFKGDFRKSDFILHRDGDRANNSLDNLVLCTRSKLTAQLNRRKRNGKTECSS